MPSTCRPADKNLDELMPLWRLARQSGNVQAERRLFEMCYEQAFRITLTAARLYCKRQFSDDLLQELRIGTIEGMVKWDPDKGGITDVLYFQARASVTRNRRQEWRGLWAEFPAVNPNLIAPMADNGTLSVEHPETQLADLDSAKPYDLTELQIDIAKAVNHLTIKQRKAVQLCFGLNGQRPHTYREIAQMWGQDHTNVHHHMQRALKRLACELQAYA